jgi:hypothetical protein
VIDLLHLGDSLRQSVSEVHKFMRLGGLLADSP